MLLAKRAIRAPAMASDDVLPWLAFDVLDGALMPSSGPLFFSVMTTSRSLRATTGFPARMTTKRS